MAQEESDRLKDSNDSKNFEEITKDSDSQTETKDPKISKEIRVTHTES